jgi:hypothetical protein
VGAKPALVDFTAVTAGSAALSLLVDLPLAVSAALSLLVDLPGAVSAAVKAGDPLLGSE